MIFSIEKVPVERSSGAFYRIFRKITVDSGNTIENVFDSLDNVCVRLFEEMRKMDIRRAVPTAGYVVGTDKQMEYGKISRPESDDITKHGEKELRDTVQISDEAYRMQIEDQKVSATSGNDILGISKGASDNEYVVHFSDSAMVNRAVSRGYIKVNDTKITLSDDEKEKLLKTDREAEQKRLRAYESYVMEHEAAVAKQQGETLSRAYEDLINRLSEFGVRFDRREVKIC